MSREQARELRSRPAAEPVLDAEEEIDLARYATAVAARWWLLLLGLVAGVVVGYLLSVGGSDVYRAQALIYLGDPLAPSGARVSTSGTSISSLRELVTAEASVRRAAAASELRPAQVRRGIFLQQVSGGTARTTGQPSLVNVGVRGEAPGRVAAAANELARIAVADASRYVNAKIATLESQIASFNQELESLDRRIEASLAAERRPGLSDTERMIALFNAGVLEQRRSTVLQQRSDRQQLLALAENVERPQLLKRAVAREVTAQSRRNSLVAAGAIGLLLGLFAALLWEPVAARVARRGR